MSQILTYQCHSKRIKAARRRDALISVMILVVVMGFFAIWNAQMARVEQCSITYQESNGGRFHG